MLDHNRLVQINLTKILIYGCLGRVLVEIKNEGGIG